MKLKIKNKYFFENKKITIFAIVLFFVAANLFFCDLSRAATESSLPTENVLDSENNLNYAKDGGVVDISTGQKLEDRSASAAQQIQSINSVAIFKPYQLLESFPGFFSKNQKAPDFPTMILAIYKFGIWTVGIAGLFMLTVGGFMYMASAGNNSTATSAKGIITDALLGIVAALGAYLFMYVINPDLTSLKISLTSVEISEPDKMPVGGSVAAAGRACRALAP